MSTAKAPKKPQRWTGGDERAPEEFGGLFGIMEPTCGAVFGAIISYWSHVEEQMMNVFEELVGGEPARSNWPVSTASRQVFRGVLSQQTRIKLMRALLRKTPQNAHRGPEYDDIIDEFDALNSIRNDYVHGIWMWTPETRTLRYWAPTPEDFMSMPSRVVEIAEFQGTLQRMQGLLGKILDLRRLPT